MERGKLCSWDYEDGSIVYGSYEHFPVNYCLICGEPLTEPEALTPEQLKQMDGEPVWIVLRARRSWETSGGAWSIVCWDYADAINHPKLGRLFRAKYGKTWVAYDRKPGERIKP